MHILNKMSTNDRVILKHAHKKSQKASWQKMISTLTKIVEAMMRTLRLAQLVLIEAFGTQIGPITISGSVK